VLVEVWLYRLLTSFGAGYGFPRRTSASSLTRSTRLSSHSLLSQGKQRMRHDFAGVVERMERLRAPLEYAWGVMSHLTGVKNSDPLRDAHQELQVGVIFGGFPFGPIRMMEWSICVFMSFSPCSCPAYLPTSEPSSCISLFCCALWPCRFLRRFAADVCSPRS